MKNLFKMFLMSSMALFFCYSALQAQTSVTHTQLSLDNIKGIRYNGIEEPRFLGDTITMRTWNGDNKQTDDCWKVIKHSADGLIDTITTGCGSGIWDIVNVFDDKGILQSSELFLGAASHSYYDTRTVYVYDPEDGKLLEEISNYGGAPSKKTYITYEYSSTGHSIDEYGGNQYNIGYTKTGFIVKGPYIAGQYDFDSEGRLIRRGNFKYTYFDGGYSYADDSTKVEHLINKDGFITKETKYKLNKTGEYVMTEYTINTYIKKTTVSNEICKRPEYNVYSGIGEIVVNTDEPVDISVFSISGQLIKSVPSNGYIRIAVSKGFYIVKVGNRSFKILVR